MTKPAARLLVAALGALALAILLVAFIGARGDSGANASAAAKVPAPTEDAPAGADVPAARDVGQRAIEGERRDVATLDAPSSAPLPELPAGTVRGRVSDKDDTPLPGASVVLTQRRAGTLVARVELTTDVDGRYSTVMESLATLTPFDAHFTRIQAAVEQPGFMPARESRSLSDPRGCVDDLDLVSAAGASLRGRVVDSAGRPVAGARIRGRTAGGRSSFYGRFGNASECDDYGEFVSTDEGGAFCVALLRGSATVLVAEASGVGWASVEVPTPRDADCVDVGTIVLEQLGTLAGRVVDVSGRPIGGCSVSASLQDRSSLRAAASGNELSAAQQAELIESLRSRSVTIEPDALVFDDDWHSSPALESAAEALASTPGTQQAVSVTSDDGRFWFAGLAVGRYALVVTGGSIAPAETGATGVELELRGDWLHVRVVDSDGAVLPDVDVCGSYVEGGPGKSTGKPALRLTRERGGADVFERVRVPSRILLRLSAPSVEPAPQFVEPVRGVTLVTLVARPLQASGRLRVVLQQPDGAPWPSFSVHLRTPDTEHEIASFFAFDTDEDDWSPELPGGLYDVEVRPLGRGRGVPPPWLPVEQRGVTIGPHSAPELTLQTRDAARLSLTLVADGLDVQKWGSALTAIDSRGRKLRLTGRHDSPVVPAGGTWFEATVDIEQLFEPGAVELRAALDGFEPASATFVLRAGERNEVELRLVRK